MCQQILACELTLAVKHASSSEAAAEPTVTALQGENRGGFPAPPHPAVHVPTNVPIGATSL